MNLVFGKMVVVVVAIAVGFTFFFPFCDY